MRAENRHRAGGHLVQFLDEAGALGLERFDDIAIMHDLVADIDRRAILLQRALDDLDGADDPGAKPARLGKNDLHSLHPYPSSDWPLAMTWPVAGTEPDRPDSPDF